MWKITKRNVTFASAFHDPSSKDCKQSNSMQTRALLNLDKKYCIIFVRAKQMPVKGLIDNSCHALEAVPERCAIHKLNAYFFLQKIMSECKYRDLHVLANFRFISEYIQEKSLIHVKCVRKDLQTIAIFRHTREYIQEKSLLHVKCVLKDS